MLGNTDAIPTGGPPCTLWIKDFGGPKGTVCTYYRDNRKDLHNWAHANGFYCSFLGDPYFQYDREFFIDTLDDWGWFSDGPPPPWYMGRPW